jgi:cell division protein FtsA
VVPSFVPAPAAPVAPATPAASTPEPPKPVKEQRGLKFLGDITRKLKGILIDDFDDKQY